MNTDQFASLLSALRGAPRLPGAACRGHWETFDDIDEPDYAISVCLNHCPALSNCRQWADSQPKRNLYGVIAGEVFLQPRIRRRAGAA